MKEFDPDAGRKNKFKSKIFQGKIDKKIIFFKDELVVPRAGLEPATTRSSASPSIDYYESGALPD